MYTPASARGQRARDDREPTRLAFEDYDSVEEGKLMGIRSGFGHYSPNLVLTIDAPPLAHVLTCLRISITLPKTATISKIYLRGLSQNSTGRDFLHLGR